MLNTGIFFARSSEWAPATRFPALNCHQALTSRARERGKVLDLMQSVWGEDDSPWIHHPWFALVTGQLKCAESHCPGGRTQP